LCKYTAVKKAALELGLKLTENDEEDWDIFWTDMGLNIAFFKSMKNY